MLSSLHNQTRHLLWVVAILSPIQAIQDSHILCKLTHRGAAQLASGVCDANRPHCCCGEQSHRSSCPLVTIANGSLQGSEPTPEPTSPCHCPPGSTCCQASQPQTETARCRVGDDDNAVVACGIDAALDRQRPTLAAASISRTIDAAARSLDVCAVLCRFTI